MKSNTPHTALFASGRDGKAIQIYSQILAAYQLIMRQKQNIHRPHQPHLPGTGKLSHQTVHR